MKNKIIELKTIQDNDDFQVEYSLIPEYEAIDQTSEFYSKAQNEIDILNGQIKSLENKVAELNKDIDRLTNHADGIDYTIAVSCGIITGLIDSFFVGEWNFEKAKKISNEEVNRKVIEFAKKDPEYNLFLERKKNGNRDGNRLENAVQFLENKYSLPGDSAYKDIKTITHKTHHLDDFCHHPTLFGMICCIIVQFTGSTRYCDKESNIIKIPITVNEYGNFVCKNPITKLFSGIINWFFIVAKTISNRRGHLMSDIAGSIGSAKKGNDGMGIPGSFLSTLKELFSLPIIRDTNFGEKLSNAFTNGIGNGKNQVDLGVFNNLFEGASSKFDMRTEMAVKHELKRQSMPIIINEILVRAVYFIRRFIEQLKLHNDISKLDWKTMIPIKNRTIVRMMTIASGTFVAVDLADATIRSTIKSGGFIAGFAKNFILRVNFVGIGRLAIAVFSDLSMENKKIKTQYERIDIYNQMLLLSSAKLHYKQIQTYELLNDFAKTEENIWRTLADNERGFIELLQLYEQSVQESINTYCEHHEIVNSIGNMIPNIAKNNPGLIEWMLDIL